METRSGAHGQRPPLSETKEAEILSQDQKQRLGEVPAIPLVRFEKISVGGKNIVEKGGFEKISVEKKNIVEKGRWKL